MRDDFIMNDLLKFWKYIKTIWDSQEMTYASEDFEFDISQLKQANLIKLSDEEIISLFGDVIDFVMDGLGIDNYGEIYDMLLTSGINETRAKEIMDA